VNAHIGSKSPATRALSAEDRLEIQELIARYCRYEDNGDAQAMAALFAEDGCTVNSRGQAIAGRDALEEAARRRWESPDARRCVHWVTNVIVEPSDDGASASSYQLIFMVDADSGIHVRSLSAKHDRLRRDGGRWLFVTREVVPLAAG
jgi:uncharacterized protein (TIGR02246 family)